MFQKSLAEQHIASPSYAALCDIPTSFPVVCRVSNPRQQAALVAAARACRIERALRACYPYIYSMQRERERETERETERERERETEVEHLQDPE